MSENAWIFDQSDGRIRPLRDSDPQSAHDAAAKAAGFHAITRPVVYADGRIMGELLQVEDDHAPVCVAREGGVDRFVITMPVRTS